MAEQPRLSPELVAALTERPLRPMRELFRLFRADGARMPLALLFALVLAAGGVIFESLLFRRLLEIGNELVPSRQRLAAVGFLLLFLTALTRCVTELTFAQWIQNSVEPAHSLLIVFVFHILNLFPLFRDAVC